jgi:hypothetical protein
MYKQPIPSVGASKKQKKTLKEKNKRHNLSHILVPSLLRGTK